MTANIGNVTEEKKINAEQKTGEATIINHFGSKFNSLEIRHRLGNDSKYEQKAIFTNIDDGKMVGPFKFTYEIGSGSWYSYWYIKIVTSDDKWYKNKDDFHCSLSASDDGKVTIIIYGDKPHFKVVKSDSDSCSCSLYSAGAT
jgi:hypothetical protein